MKENSRKRKVDFLLGALVVLDLVLCIWAFFFPEFWFRFFHDSEYIDPQGLLRRCAANWLAFFVVQLVALIRWRRNHEWLMIVAGCRLGDILTDVTCLIFCERITLYGLIAFPLAGFGNLAFGIMLIRIYRTLKSGNRH